MRLTFVEFDLEDSYNLFNVYDGKDMSEPIIGSFSRNLSYMSETIFSSGTDIYMAFERYSNAKSCQFEIRYDAIECDWSDWEIGSCSQPCGGGQQTKTRSLRNNDQNTKNCGPTYLIEPCNMQNCTYTLFYNRLSDLKLYC